MAKFYACDTGLAVRLSKASDGALFENCVFSAIRAHGGEVRYYQRKNGVEIDFIANKSAAYEAQLVGSDRDVQKLKELAEDFDLSDSRVVSRKYAGIPGIIYDWMR